jgi:hypothetical protein
MKLNGFWGPVESPFTAAKKSAFKLIGTITKVAILMLSAWRMKPSHFHSDTQSIYKNLGFWLPLIPGSVYAWAAQHIFAPPMAEAGFPTFYLPLGNTLIVVVLVHFTAALSFGFHTVMCWVGRTVFDIRETPPAYEFFLVRNAGGFMWFSISLCLLTVPILQAEGGLTGRIAALLLALPLLYGGAFTLASFSSMRAGSTSKVGLTDMYHSDQFVALLWRTKIGLAVATLGIMIALARHPEILNDLILSAH